MDDSLKEMPREQPDQCNEVATEVLAVQGLLSECEDWSSPVAGNASNGAAAPQLDKAAVAILAFVESTAAAGVPNEIPDTATVNVPGATPADFPAVRLVDV